MIRCIFILYCILCISICCFATNIPAGHITTNTTWTKTGSPYIITGNVVFDTNTVLTVDPGVVIRFDSIYTITINGKLNMQGIITDSITITSNIPGITKSHINNGNSWNGFHFGKSNHTDTNYINYCRFTYAYRAVWIQEDAPPVKILNSSFSVCLQAITIHNTAISIDKCSFYDVNTSVYSYNGSYTVTNSSFLNGEYGISGNWINNTYCANNIFQNNATGVVKCNNVINNIFIGNKVRAIENCTNVHYNHIWFNKIGLDYMLSAASNLSATHNSIAYNSTGISYSVHSGSVPNIKYNCIAHNQQYDFNYSGPDLDVTNNYWGTTDSTKIDSNVYDYHDFPGSSLGKLIFMPLLSIPDSACDTIVIPTKINTVYKKLSTVTIFPNPTNSVFTIESDLYTINEVFIYNITGIMLSHTTPYKNKLAIDVSSFTNGIYIYKVKLNDGNIQTGKLRKE